MHRCAVVFAGYLLLTLGCTAEQLRVAQLEGIVAEIHSASDKKAAEKLDGMELSERLSATRLARLAAALPGPESRQKLQVIADSAAFLKLPAQDLLPNPAPDAAAMRKIITSAEEFVSGAITKLPDFTATRVTSRFRDFTPPSELAHTSLPLMVTPGVYRFVDRHEAGISYRDGKEVVDAGQRGKGSDAATGVTDLGLFGPLLGVVAADMLRGKVFWDHWEQGPSGALAVFRFTVPKESSRFTVHYCCVRNASQQPSAMQFTPPYYGEIAIDPETGSVFRLAVQADTQSASTQSNGLLTRAGVFIEYGEVQIGPRKYICPLRSTSISTGAALYLHGVNYRTSNPPDPTVPAVIPHGGVKNGKGDDNYQQVTWMNEVLFENYHVFTSEVRMIPGGGME